jgi:hypothetical protein
MQDAGHGPPKTQLLLNSSVGKGKILLTKLPYNRPTSCNLDAMIHALNVGYEPAA